MPYAVLVLGLYHGLLIPNDFGSAARYAPVDPLAFDKVLVELAIGGVLHTRCAVRRSGSEKEPGRTGGVWVWASS